MIKLICDYCGTSRQITYPGDTICEVCKSNSNTWIKEITMIDTYAGCPEFPKKESDQEPDDYEDPYDNMSF